MKKTRFLLCVLFLCCLALFAGCKTEEQTPTDTGFQSESDSEIESESGSEIETEPEDPCAKSHDLVADAEFYTCRNCDYKHAVSTGLAYSVISEEEKTCSIVGIGTCTDTELYIPGVIDEYHVTSIGYEAFSGCTSLASITIPDSVTSIGYEAFRDCTNLYSITLSDSVTSIGRYAFYDCPSLTSIMIPDSVTSIGESAFLGCYNLAHVYIADLEAWCQISFKGYTSNPLHYGADLYLNSKHIKRLKLITEVEFSDTLNKINDFVFVGCKSITSITIPDSVTSIGNSAFYNCANLASIMIPDSVTNIGTWAFSGCDSLTSITIPNGVRSIDEGTFAGCWSLTHITLSNRVTFIGDFAFEGSTNVSNVYYTGTAEDWTNISIGSYNSDLNSATRYYYSETHPTAEGNYWHYVDGVPTVWGAVLS